MRNIKPLLLFALFAIVSCAEKSAVVIETVQLPMSIKTDAIPLKSELIHLKDSSIYVHQYVIYNDSLLIVCDAANNEGKIIKVYEYPSQRFITSLISQGRGPGEVLLARYAANYDELILDDILSRRIAFIPMDSLVNSAYKPTFIKYGFIVQSMAKYNENQLLLENFYKFEDDALGIYNDADRFAVIDNGSPKSAEEVLGKYEHSALSVSGAKILVNKEKNSVVYAKISSPTLEFYDYSLNLKKSYTTPDEFDIKYKLFGDIIMSAGGATCFSTGCNTEDFVYITYNGVTTSDYLNLPTWILKFDWQGNFIKSYYYNRYIHSMTKGKGKGVFYVTTYDENRSPQLVKLFL